MRKLFILFLLLCSQKVFAFDRLECLSSLDDSVVVAAKPKTKPIAILGNKVTRASLTEREAPVIKMLSSDGQILVSVAPWQGIEILEKHRTAQINFLSDKQSWFSVTVKKAKNKKDSVESFECRLTF